MDTSRLQSLFGLEGKRAVGVEYRQGSQLRTARGGTVIACGGAFNSPQLLQISGVGPSDAETVGAG